MLLGSGISSALDHILPSEVRDLTLLLGILALLVTISFWACVWGTFAVTAKRLNYQGFPGRIIVIVLFVLGIGFEFDLLGPPDLHLFLGLLLLVMLLIPKGTDGSNKYGPDPLANDLQQQPTSE